MTMKRATALVACIAATLLCAGCASRPFAHGGFTRGERFAAARPLTLITIDLTGTLSPRFFDALAGAMPDWSPDIVLFQGVRESPLTLGGRAQVREWADRAGFDHLYFAPTRRTDRGGHLLAIASRVAAAGPPQTELVARTHDQPTEPLRQLSREPMLYGMPFAWGGGEVMVWTARLPPFDLFDGETDAMPRLLATVNDGPTPFIVGIQAGSPADGNPQGMLSAEWTDSFDEAGTGLGYTAPNPVPNAREAYFYLPKERSLRATKHFALGVRGCRNLPLLVRLERPPPKQEPTTQKPAETRKAPANLPEPVTRFDDESESAAP